MRPITLALRALTYYWRTNAAVVLGVATAVAVLAGALLMGVSVRASLRDLVLQRLGATDVAVVGSSFFREALADNLAADAEFSRSFASVCPIVAVQGLVSEQASGRRASRVQVYGVDERFWKFHAIRALDTLTAVPSEAEGRQAQGREALLSPALAAEIGAEPGATILVRVQRPSEIPIESMHGQKDDPGETLRLTVRAIVGPESLGEFSLQPQQGEVRALFVPLDRLQEDLGIQDRVNVLLVAGQASDLGGRTEKLSDLIRRHARLEDVGLSLAIIESQGVLALQSDAGLIDEPRAEAVREALAAEAADVQPVLTYLANSLRSESGEVPYSLVTATDLGAIAPGLAIESAVSGPPPIVLNDWAARDLRVKTGDALSLEYYVWEEPGNLATRTTDFRVAGVVPIAGAAADRELAPVYPGITQALGLSDWDPPFPIDLSRVRPIDEEYWNRYRTTPKAFVAFEVGQALWRSRYGALTSIRVRPKPGLALADARDRIDQRLRAALDPLAFGLAVRDVRAESVAASRGATDFGEYFTYFSFFLVVSALLLAALFFKLGIEQRAREVGLLRAVGFDASHLRRLFLTEGLALTLIGSVLGVVGAVGYGYLLMTGLRTWWVDAVGTTALRLHVSPVALLAGAGGVTLVAIACIWWTLRGLARVSERSLLAGLLVSEQTASAERGGSRRLWLAALGLLAVAVALTAAAGTGLASSTGGFFGAGAAMLVSFLCFLAWRWRQPSRAAVAGRGWWPVARLGIRNVSDRPGRSVMSVAVMAAAAFILVSVDAFRREGSVALTDPHSGVGGYSLMVESLLPIAHDPNSIDGRERLGLSGLDVAIEPFRVMPGDDASCLNLYEPTNPRILAPGAGFIRSGRFAFRRSLASTDAERANPWLLLERDLGDGVVPVIADANSMTYVLHREVGDELTLRPGAQPVKLRLVAALDDSIFQSELLMSEANFLKLFPRQQGYGLLLVQAPASRTGEITKAIEERLADFGADARSTAERLAEFHRVENTYLSTFQTLGGLGLLLGTVGLAAVLLRNVLERRRELALLAAVGYRGAHFLLMLVAENGVLLAWGLAAGTLSALLAIVPAAAERGGRLPLTTGAGLLLFSVFMVGVLSSIVAARAATRAPLLETLRSD